MDRSAARFAAALAPASPADPSFAAGSLTVDLTAQSAALARASVRYQYRTLLHARDAVDEWAIATELRPPTVRAYEAATAALLASATPALEEGWQSTCAACGQSVRVAAWRWEDPFDADRDHAQPTARRATCAACRALGRRGGDAATIPSGESVRATPLEPEVRAQVEARFAGATDGAAERWSTRQLRALQAMSRALEGSTESAVMLAALRLTLTEAAATMARPQRSGRSWWEVAPWQAMLEAIETRRRIYLTAQSLPPQLTMSSDLSALSYPGAGAILLRGGASSRTSLASLIARTPSVAVACVRICVGGSSEERIDRAVAARWAGEVSEGDPLQIALQSNDAATIAAALARLIVTMDPLIRQRPRLVIDLDDHPEQIAGVLTAVRLAGAVGDVSRRRDDERPGLTISVRFDASPERPSRTSSQIALISDLVVAHGEPVTARQLLPAYAAVRAREAHASGELLDPAAFLADLQRCSDIHATLRPTGSFDQLIALAEGRIFVEARAQRERLASPATDRADAAVWALVADLGREDRADEALVALDADPIGVSSEMRSALLDAYTVVSEEVRTPRASQADLADERLMNLAGLLELGPRMGLYTAVSPSLADRVVAGRSLGARTTIDPIDASPPLRTRSDRGAFDAVDVILYRRGRVVLLCEVITGPLPLGDLLLNQHARIASDPEVVRLLLLAPALVSLLQLRLAADERLAAAWESGNWHLLATDRIAALSRLPAPRLADLEGHLGAEPPQRQAAQLDLSSLGWDGSQSRQHQGGDHEPTE